MTGFNANALANATPSTGMDDSQPPPVGLYEVVIDGAEAFQSKAGNDIAKLDLRVATGDHAGHAWTEIYGFKTPKSYDFFKGVCERLGVDLSPVVDLPSLDGAVKAVVGNWYMVDVVESRGVKDNGEPHKNSVFFRDGGPITASTPAVPVASEFQPVQAQPGQPVTSAPDYTDPPF